MIVHLIRAFVLGPSPSRHSLTRHSTRLPHARLPRPTKVVQGLVLTRYLHYPYPCNLKLRSRVQLCHSRALSTLLVYSLPSLPKRFFVMVELTCGSLSLDMDCDCQTPRLHPVNSRHSSFLSPYSCLDAFLSFALDVSKCLVRPSRIFPTDLPADLPGPYGPICLRPWPSETSRWW